MAKRYEADVDIDGNAHTTEDGCKVVDAEGSRRRVSGLFLQGVCLCDQCLEMIIKSPL